MLTLRGEHFYFTENIGVIFRNWPLAGALDSAFPVPRPSNLVPDALAGRISRGKGICSAGPRGTPLSLVFSQPGTPTGDKIAGATLL